LALTVKQRGVLKGIIFRATMTFVVIVGAILARPMVLSPEATVGERLFFALWADAFIALWLGISIGMLARHRFFTPEDIDGGGLAPGSETANITHLFWCSSSWSVRSYGRRSLGVKSVGS
jgi:hypothetical protein